MTSTFTAFAVSFLLTLAFEYPVALLFRVRRKMDLLLILPINLLTNPAVVAANMLLQPLYPFHPLSLQIFLEILVVAAEYKLYQMYAADTPHPFLLSLCANSFSYGMGLLIQSIL